jgi:hypothetical protein
LILSWSARLQQLENITKSFHTKNKKIPGTKTLNNDFEASKKMCLPIKQPVEKHGDVKSTTEPPREK